jgi:hypothetical protein|tara:strand:- start:190 stop:675 length:486 start_codon:yes stop_codon:yes gene_type:complete
MENSFREVESVTWPRALEAILEILVKLAGLYMVYKFGSIMMDSVDASNTLFSILMLPALLILRDAHIILEPFTIRTQITDSEVTVTRGLLTRKSDRLSIKTLENIELVKTPLGRLNIGSWCSYGTLNLYAYGGTVVMPYLKNPKGIQTDIEAILKKITENN